MIKPIDMPKKKNTPTATRQEVDAQTAMEMLGISRATLSRYLESGDLRGRKMGLGLRSKVFVYVESIEELKRKRESQFGNN